MRLFFFAYNLNEIKLKLFIGLIWLLKSMRQGERDSTSSKNAIGIRRVFSPKATEQQRARLTRALKASPKPSKLSK